MYSDAAKNPELGFGAICQDSWMYSKWDPSFIIDCNPSIEYLELWAVVAGVLTWIKRFKNQRIILFCDNMSAVEMINNTSSTCKNCMILIRLLVLESLKQNVRVFARHVSGKSNFYSDALSRIDLSRFWRLSYQNGKQFESNPTEIPAEIWPLSKIWLS